MNKGLWVWPSDSKEQGRILQKIVDSAHLMATLAGLAKSKDGLSNTELDDLLATSSNWIALWPVRELTSLGFIEYKVDIFGGPGRYIVTELGRNALSTITAQTAQPKIPVPIIASAAQVAAPKR